MTIPVRRPAGKARSVAAWARARECGDEARRARISPRPPWGHRWSVALLAGAELLEVGASGRHAAEGLAAVEREDHADVGVRAVVDAALRHRGAGLARRTDLVTVVGHERVAVAEVDLPLGRVAADVARGGHRLEVHAAP